MDRIVLERYRYIYKLDIKYGYLKQKNNYIKCECVKLCLDVYFMIICYLNFFFI